MIKIKKLNLQKNIEYILKNKEKYNYLLFSQTNYCIDCLGLILNIIFQNKIKRKILPIGWSNIEKKKLYQIIFLQLKNNNNIIFLPSRKFEKYNILLSKIKQNKIFNHLAIITHDYKILHTINNKVNINNLNTLKRMTHSIKIIGSYKVDK